MNKITVICIITSLLASYQVIAGSDQTVINVKKVKSRQQLETIKQRAKKGDLIAFHPIHISSVCDFNKTIFVNNYTKGVPVTAYCYYAGYVRKHVYK